MSLMMSAIEVQVFMKTITMHIYIGENKCIYYGVHYTGILYIIQGVQNIGNACILQVFTKYQSNNRYQNAHLLGKTFSHLINYIILLFIGSKFFEYSVQHKTSCIIAML